MYSLFVSLAFESCHLVLGILDSVSGHGQALQRVLLGPLGDGDFISRGGDGASATVVTVEHAARRRAGGVGYVRVGGVLVATSEHGRGAARLFFLLNGLLGLVSEKRHVSGCGWGWGE